jgi:hypothetical protein
MHTGDTGESKEDTMKEFFLVVRDALLIIVRWIEKRYMGGSRALHRDQRRQQ